jgi:hypothetical protein
VDCAGSDNPGSFLKQTAKILAGFGLKGVGEGIDSEFCPGGSQSTTPVLGD